MHAIVRAAFLVLLVQALAGVALGQEYCVTCTGPDAKYRCIVGNKTAPAPHSERGQMLCITELAKSGSHASCSVGAATSAPCTGDVKTVMFPSLPEPVAPPVAEAPALEEGAPVAEDQSATAGSADEPSPPAPGPPKTVEELAKNTGKAVTDTAQSAGNAVGSAVKKTWTCLSSFFGDC